MIHLNEIPLDFEPRREILPLVPEFILPEGCEEPEMSEFDSAFLCGVLKKFRPKKILEVGIASGATTAIILQALENLNVPYEMHSVDIAADFYRDPSKPSGYVVMFAKEKIFGELRGTHEFHLGKYLPQVIDGIGGEIDCMILDTFHVMPGEVLDFLAVLPYLTDNAVVILHDVAFNHFKLRYVSKHAATVLFSAVTAEKFLNFHSDDDLFLYPNIAAFQINQQTRDNIENVFLSMILRWSYLLSDKELVFYREHYRRFYPAELCAIFQEAIDMNAYNFYLSQRQ